MCISSCCSVTNEMMPRPSQLYAEPLFPLLLYIVWIQVVRYFNQKSCAVRNCVIYMVWELPRSLQPFSSTNMRTAGSNSMKRSSTFPRLSHLTSTCVATSEYSPWSSFTNERSSVFRNEAPFATIMLTVWVRNPSSLWALHLFVCCTVVRDAKYEKFGIWGSFVSKAITPFSYHGRSSPIGSPGKQPSVDGFGWSMKKSR